MIPLPPYSLLIKWPRYDDSLIHFFSLCILSTNTHRYESKDASGQYSCEPSVGAEATVTVHVLHTKTEVRAVLGEGKYLFFDRHEKLISEVSAPVEALKCDFPSRIIKI